MMRQVLIPLRGCSSDRGQVVPGAGGEVVMLNVVSQIQVQYVPDSKIVISLNSLGEFMVFSNDVDSRWMGAN